MENFKVPYKFMTCFGSISPLLEVRVALYVSMCCVYATYSLIAVPCSKHEMKINIRYGRQMLLKGRKNLNLHTPTHTNGLPRRKRLGRRVRTRNPIANFPKSYNIKYNFHITDPCAGLETDFGCRRTLRNARDDRLQLMCCALPNLVR